jgi:hypothetical protein
VFKKITVILLALSLCFAFTLPAYAADASALSERIAYLKQTYGIAVDYDTEPDGSPCIGTGALGNLEMALKAITPEVTREVSAYMNDRYGHGLSFRFAFDYSIPGSQDIPAGQTATGMLDTQTGIIYLVVPSGSRGTFASGDNPLTAAHETGHVIHMMLGDRYGQNKLQAEWVAINGSYSYKGQMVDNSYSDTVFFSEYAATEYGEDFAETFAHCVTRNRAGLGYYYLLSTDLEERTILGKKVDYLTSLLEQGLPGSANLVAGIRFSSVNTPANLYWREQRFYGMKLHYSGCSYPRYVLNGIAAGVGLEIDESSWISELGGWYVLDRSGDDYFVFPEGYIDEAKLAAPLAS